MGACVHGKMTEDYRGTKGQGKDPTRDAEIVQGSDQRLSADCHLGSQMGPCGSTVSQFTYACLSVRIHVGYTETLNIYQSRCVNNEGQESSRILPLEQFSRNAP